MLCRNKPQKRQGSHPLPPSVFFAQVKSLEEVQIICSAEPNQESSIGDQIRSPLMEFRSRIYASSKGITIDAIGQGQYLVCKPSGCTKVKGLHNAHAVIRQQEPGTD